MTAGERAILADLTEAQRQAVTASGMDILVEAGAGSGKTRTLVARYLAELASGTGPRQIAAITFTEKAAREMRNRIRTATQRQAEQADDNQSSKRWWDIAAAMDGARIGTIHSLCAEIIRNHPAEAAVDPAFEVLEEGTARLLQHEAVEAAMVAAANDSELAEIFRHYSPWALQDLLFSLLAGRLEVAEHLSVDLTSESPSQWLLRPLKDFAGSQPVVSAIDQLRTLADSGYFQAESTDSMAAMASELLAGWSEFAGALQAGNAFSAAGAMFRLRRQAMKSRVGRRDGPARAAVDDLQSEYDQQLDPWLGGSSSRDDPPDPDLEALYGVVQSRLTLVFLRAQRLYLDELANRASLDFDGLEAKALELLELEPVRSRWQQNIKRVLVDEYQDTNQRQRQIITALTENEVGKLFVVGDARQSIYRFRGADVTIFQELASDLDQEGAVFALDRTFRQHPGLLEIYERLLSEIMADEREGAAFQVEYQGLQTDRKSAQSTTSPPFLEFLVGLGPRADQARPVAASMLASRLLMLRREGELSSWEQVALLFRASTGFSSYEDALTEANIPYVTVAGRGFYERPEIREVLNTLRALAEPWNQAAMVGLLRSSAIGLSDVGVYQLRVGPDGPRPLLAALQEGADGLSEMDELARQRALEMLAELTPLVDRLPVADLLKAWMDWTDASALLAIAGERHWANLDKLLVDARRSGTTGVRAFLEYIRLTQQAGVREGEAPAESYGAVRLMTIHKAKGLEFPYVVLADAGYQRRSSTPAYLVDPRVGVALRPNLWDSDSLRYRLARSLDAKMEAAEEERLLYVALTRASEKALISGHARATEGGVRPSGWLADLLSAAQVSNEELQPGTIERPGFVLSIGAQPPEINPLPVELESPSVASADQLPLYPPIPVGTSESTDEDLDEPPARAWRASGRRAAPASVIGVLVHRALERWYFPGNEALHQLLMVGALSEGLVEEKSQQAAVDSAVELLERFSNHPLRREIEASPDRFHEIPYSYQPDQGPPDSGALDLLYRHQGGWRVLDFKTDAIADEAALTEAIQEHHQQIERYLLAASRLLEEPVSAAVIFLDAMGEIKVVEASS